jgi:cholesterol oxidase
VTALHVTEKGYRVGVLEAGRRFADSDFPATSPEVRWFLWAPRLGCRRIQRIHLLKDVFILAGSGGGSLIGDVPKELPALAGVGRVKP